MEDENRNKPEIHPVLEYVNSLNLVSYLLDSRLDEIRKGTSSLGQCIRTLRRSFKKENELKLLNEVNEGIVQLNKYTDSLSKYKDERVSLGHLLDSPNQLYQLIDLGRKIVVNVSGMEKQIKSIEVKFHKLSPYIPPNLREKYLTLLYEIKYMLKLIQEILAYSPIYEKK
jgi:hypothetical protein